MTIATIRPSVLIVDSDVEHCDELSRRLEEQGFATTQAASGTQAVELIQLRPFDVVLLDAELSGTGGVEVLRRIRRTKTCGQLPVLLLATAHRGDDILAALKAGANDFVSKPVNLPVALARIQSQLARKQVEAHLGSLGPLWAEPVAASL